MIQKPREQLASQYPRTSQGWIQFPQDVQLRDAIFPKPEGGIHPARANLYMLMEIAKLVSKPGDSILDPMAGVGSIMIAATMDRRVVCIEIEEPFFQLQLAAIPMLEDFHPGAGELITCIHGDCRKFLPMPVDHIIFSPPYATALRRGTTSKTEAAKAVEGTLDIVAYSQTAGNVGALNSFLYNMTMEKVYQLCYSSLQTGGTLTFIIKDNVLGQKRQLLTDWAVRCCLKLGFQVRHWFKRESMGTGFLKLRKSRGEFVVNDEDIVIMKKL